MKLIEVGSTGGPLRALTVVLREGRRSLPAGDLRRALRLFLGSGAWRLRVEFCGEGVWGLRGRWLAPVREILREAAVRGREVGIAFRCAEPPPPGILRTLAALDARVILSWDGSGDLRAAGERLHRLQAAGVDAVLELPLTPEDLPGLAARLGALSALAPAQVRIRPLMGLAWEPGSAALLLRTLGSWLSGLNQKLGDRPQILDIANLYEDEAPELLADDVRLGPDGGLVWRPALEHARVWPELGKAAPPARLEGLDSIAPLFPEPASRLAAVRRSLSGDSRDLWLRNVHLALRLKSFFIRPIRGYRDASENATVKRGLLAADFRTQDRFLRLRLPGMDCLFYFIRSGCVNDCIFCKRKVEDPGQTLGEVEASLRQNLKVGRRKIALLGNEPLLHPRIVDIIRLCRRCGFREVEVMTSGSLLADRALTEAVVKAGATSFPIPVYSSDAGEHDALTRHPGSFREVLEGIENLRRTGKARIYLHTNLMEQNLRSVAALERFALKELRLPFSILPVRPKDPDSMNYRYEDLAPSYARILREVRVSTLAAFPVCIQRRIQDPPVIPSSDIADGIKLYILHQNFVKPESCLSCPDYRRCVGTFRQQLDAYPGDLRLLKP